MLVLGLDLGVASVGWALIELDSQLNPARILAMGSRIVNLANKEESNFLSGKGETACSQRTMKRTMRKGYERFEMRRDNLLAILAHLGMLDADHKLDNLPPLQLWELRSRAATPGQRLTLAELGRVIRHLNKKRGYRHAKSSANEESKDTDYVAAINNRFAALKASGLTIGQQLFEELRASAATTDKGTTVVSARLKEGDDYGQSHLYPRQAHIDEFDRIMLAQSEFYPETLTPDVIARLRRAIFFQRPLKSCKNLVSDCEFITHLGSDGKTYRPKVAPRTSPLAELTRIWEAVNNIKLTNAHNQPGPDAAHPEQLPRQQRLASREYHLNMEERRAIVEFLMDNDKITATNLLKIIGLKKADGFTPNIDPKRGIKGNSTRVKIKEALAPYPQYAHLLQFNLKIEETADTETGELHALISPDFKDEPLYRLWHLLYSVDEKADLARALSRQFGITEPELVDALYKLDFKAPGFSNKSAQFMRRILPYLMEGKIYSEAAAEAGFNHSGFITKEENDARPLRERIPLLSKNALRQPTVEKVLNQMANIVNALIDEYGPIDEIRVELARELKKSKTERAEMTSAIASRDKDNARFASLIEQYGLKPTRSRVQKYRMWEEAEGRCVYCGKQINIVSFLGGEDSEVEHIVPRALLFDDSLTNKVCSCRACNQEKGRRTAFDFMTARGEDALHAYLERVERMAANPDPKKRISKTKYRRLLMPESEIPADFLERDLRQTQYISRKAMELLRDVCRNVYASSGAVTDFFRHAWGYDEVIHDLNIERYERADLVGEEEYEHKHQIHRRRRIKDWNKRLDHRHHAIDALTVALTKQSYVQRLNNLNTERDNLRGDIESQGVAFKEGHRLLTQWAASRPHFPVSEVAAKTDDIAVSFKAGKKVATPGRRQKRADGSEFRPLVPRNALHEESVYGRHLFPIGNKDLKYCLSNLPMVADARARKYLAEALELNNGDISATRKWLKKNPLKDSTTGEPITALPCFEQRMVIRYKLATLKANQIDKIVDKAVRELVRRRFEECGSEKAFQQSILSEPLRLNPQSAPIKHVRCEAAVAPESTIAIHHDGDKPIGFAKSGNNHHAAFYRKPDGAIEQVVVQFWEALKRKELGLPIVIRDPKEAWAFLWNLPQSPEVEAVAASLPDVNWEFIQSLQLNEMFVLGLSDDEWRDGLAGNTALLTNNLYRVQTISEGDYRFRLHTHTGRAFDSANRNMRTGIYVTSLRSYIDSNPHKVKVTPTGKIIPIDD